MTSLPYIYYRGIMLAINQLTGLDLKASVYMKAVCVFYPRLLLEDEC
jgi:hypothetical protein